MIIKNIDQSSIFSFKDEIEILKNQIVSKTLIQNKNLSITLFAFDENTEISTHESSGDALVQVLEGEGKFTIGDSTYILKEGQSIIMPQNVPHAVFAKTSFKMLLTVAF